jgi:hypothetical protein
MHFPGLTAMIPCLGAALLIHFENSHVSRWILANPLAVGVGRISYSLYLVHWPIYVFFRQWAGGELCLIESLIVGIVSLLSALMMYRYIEQPFRIRGDGSTMKFHTRSFVMVFAGFSVCLVVVSLLISKGQGWAWRYPAELAKLASEAEAEKQARYSPYRERCLAKHRIPCDKPTQGVNVFIVGDSHGPDAFNALVSQYPDFHFVMYTVGGCPPLVRENYTLLAANHPNRKSCVASNEKLLYDTQLSKADLVLINTVFMWYRPEHLALSIGQIRKHTHAKIVVLGNYLFFDEDLPDMVVRHGALVMDAFYERNLAKHSLAFEDELTALSQKLDFIFVSKRQIFCKGVSIENCPLILRDKLFTYDRHHLSLAAAHELGAALKSRLDPIFSNITRYKSSIKS